MDHPSQLHRQGLELLEAAEHAGLDTPVPSCPGWVVGKLVNHSARAMERTHLVLRDHLAEFPPKEAYRPLSRDGALFDQYRRILEDTVETLATADPDGSSWNFTDENQTNAFWGRRMVHEITVHRYDAQLAAGDARPVETEWAVDGIDELVVALLPRITQRTESRLNASYHFHCTDADGEWLVVLTDGRPVTTREHAKGDVAVRGPASPLFLWICGRAGLDADGLDAFGDPELVEAWSSLTF
ncbi:MAG TPA: maleylpyruvate isomerase family mycothiol-dependent enzyme [Acidimicrobiales bacterium]